MAGSRPPPQAAPPVKLGLAAFVIGLLGLAGGGIGFLGTMNACGMFADHRTDYGKTGTGADLFATVVVYSFALALLGLIMVIVGAANKGRR